MSTDVQMELSNGAESKAGGDGNVVNKKPKLDENTSTSNGHKQNGNCDKR